VSWFNLKNISSKKNLLFIALFLGSIFCSFSQNKTQIEILRADNLIGSKINGIDVQKLVGDAQFKHQEALMFCDSAYFYKETNTIDAFGHVRINQGDTLNLYGDLLVYDGNTRIATVTGKVVKLDNPNFTLTTDRLIFDRINNTADYYSGAIIESKNDTNVLISQIGHYFTNFQLFTFKDSVVLSNPNFVMNSDTLKYFSNTEMVNFLGPTTIKGDSNLIYCENGWYDTKLDRSKYYKNAYIITDEKKLEGDSLYYDRVIGFGKALGNMTITDTAQNIIISGGHGEVYEQKDSAVISQTPTLVQIIDGDSLFMHADTFKVYRDAASNRFLFAYHGVKIFKSDLQGKCDSIAYAMSDSTIQLFKDPVLWSDSNQLTAIQIDIKMGEDEIKSIYLDKEAFIISEIDSLRYNQIKGKEMKGFFTNGELSVIKVRGNGQTTYFGQDEQQKFIGVNVAESSDMDIKLKDSGIHSISFLKKPKATMYPIGELDPIEELRYKGFKWLINLRPRSKEDIYR
jgi:lipopolysaccharide export system protein LptA